MIGNVVSSAGSSQRKTAHLGVEYDHVFDVAIEDGQPSLKLPYNVGTNPYDAATKFLEDNHLPMTQLESVARFIVENTQGATIGTATDGQGGGAKDDSSNEYLPQREYMSLLTAKFERESCCCVRRKEGVEGKKGLYLLHLC